MPDRLHESLGEHLWFLPQGGEQGAREWLRRLDGYVDVAGGTLRPTGPGSEEIHVGGRVVENAENDFLDVPEGRGIRKGTR